MVYKEGNRECINNLLKPSLFILEIGVSIRSETYDKKQALWNEIKTNAERYRKGECGKFLPDLTVHYSASFDASLLILALAFKQNNEQFEGSGYFSASEIDAYETIESFSYFKNFSKNEIAKKIRSNDKKTLAMLKEYSVSLKPQMDDILGDATIRDGIRSYLKKQWDENTKRVGEAIAIVSKEDPEWFASSPMTAKDTDKAPQTIIINAGPDAAINLGQGNIIKDAVLTGSTVTSSGCGGTTVKDSVITKSTLESAGGGLPGNGFRISDSVVTSSTITNVGKKPAEPDIEPVQQPTQYKCPQCGIIVEPGTKFCTCCGAKISAICGGCRSALLPNAKFCPDCGKKTS